LFDLRGADRRSTQRHGRTIVSARKAVHVVQGSPFSTLLMACSQPCPPAPEHFTHPVLSVPPEADANMAVVEGFLNRPLAYFDPPQADPLRLGFRHVRICAFSLRPCAFAALRCNMQEV